MARILATDKTLSNNLPMKRFLLPFRPSSFTVQQRSWQTLSRGGFKPCSTTKKTGRFASSMAGEGAKVKLHLPLSLSAVMQAQQRQQEQLQYQVQQQLQQQEQQLQAVRAQGRDEAQYAENQGPHPHAPQSSNGAAKATQESDPAATSMTVELRRIIFASPGFYALSVHADGTEQTSELARSMQEAASTAARAADGQPQGIGLAAGERTRTELAALTTDAGGPRNPSQDTASSGAAVLVGTVTEGTSDPLSRELLQWQPPKLQQQQQQQQQQQRHEQGTSFHAQAKLADRFTPEVRPDFTVICRLRGMGQARVLSTLPHRGQRLHVQGRWVLHPQYGLQLEASQICEEGQDVRFLQAGGRKGRQAHAVQPIDLLKFKLQLSQLKGDTERASHSLSVTDLTSVDWCELQTAYQTVSGKPKVATAAMQQGSSLHQALEDAAVGVTIKVPVLSKEEDLAVTLVNIISCIRQLAVEGATRELRMMAPLQGQWLVGVVDSLQIDPSTGLVSMTETKTRRQPTKPAEQQVRTAKIQVLMYHAMYEAYRSISLEDLHHYLFKVSSHWVGLHPDRLLSPQLSALCAAAGITSDSIHADAEVAALEQQGRKLLQHLVHSQATPSTQQRQEQQLQQWLEGDAATNVAGTDSLDTEALRLSDQHRIERGDGTGGNQEGGETVEHQAASYQQQAQVGTDEKRKQIQKEKKQRSKEKKRRAMKEKEEIEASKMEGGMACDIGQQQAEEKQELMELQRQQQSSKQSASPLLQAQPQQLQSGSQQQHSSTQQQASGTQQQQSGVQKQHSDMQPQHSDRKKQEAIQPALSGAQLQGVQQHSGTQQQQQQQQQQYSGIEQQQDSNRKQQEALQPSPSGEELQRQLRLGDVVQALHKSLQLLPGLGNTHGLEYLGHDGQCIAREEVEFDQHWLQSRLDTALGVWTGTAAPRPVDEDWKCSSCPFKANCWKYQPQDPSSQPSSLADRTLKLAAKAGYGNGG